MKKMNFGGVSAWAIVATVALAGMAPIMTVHAGASCEEPSMTPAQPSQPTAGNPPAAAPAPAAQPVVAAPAPAAPPAAAPAPAPTFAEAGNAPAQAPETTGRTLANTNAAAIPSDAVLADCGSPSAQFLLPSNRKCSWSNR